MVSYKALNTRREITSYGMKGSFREYHSVNTPKLKQFVYALFTQKPKNSDLRRSVSRCNRSVDQPGLEIC